MLQLPEYICNVLIRKKTNKDIKTLLTKHAAVSLERWRKDLCLAQCQFNISVRYRNLYHLYLYNLKSQRSTSFKNYKQFHQSCSRNYIQYISGWGSRKTASYHQEMVGGGGVYCFSLFWWHTLGRHKIIVSYHRKKKDINTNNISI